ncbi:MAG: 30S ribosomal protein S2 [Chlamydiae bacterium]|nr:30S ribosomal protein S2 [Chlamydiota bacterium]MBI3266170.1 30S ribosomal protein S2 [Chlamydiota bacterium]
MSVQVSVKELLEAGAHFGHQSSRWNPKMKRFIFEKRNGIHIIDLQKTVNQLKVACDFLANCVLQKESILVVGTKKQAKEIVKTMAQNCGVFWVTERWLGGTLTNLETIRKSVSRLEEIEKLKTDGVMDRLSKKEAASLTRELARLKKNLGGIQKMDRKPGVLFVIDPSREKIAVEEARRLGIPIIALIDTNCDPDPVSYPIACNDDAIRTISLIVGKVEEAILEAKGLSKDRSGGEPQSVVPEEQEELTAQE